MKIDTDTKLFKRKKTLGTGKNLSPLVRIALVVLRCCKSLLRARSSGLSRYNRALGSGLLDRLLLLMLKLLPLLMEALRGPFDLGFSTASGAGALKSSRSTTKTSALGHFVRCRNFRLGLRKSKCRFGSRPL